MYIIKHKSHNNNNDVDTISLLPVKKKNQTQVYILDYNNTSKLPKIGFHQNIVYSTKFWDPIFGKKILTKIIIFQRTLPPSLSSSSSPSSVILYIKSQNGIFFWYTYRINVKLKVCLYIVYILINKK